jgi:hypothetical protein
MEEIRQLDGFEIGDKVHYDPAVGGTGSKTRIGRIVGFIEGARGNYAKIQPLGYSAFPPATKRTDRIEMSSYVS